MVDVNYELLYKIKLLIVDGKKFKEISELLNLDIHYVIYLAKKMKK